MYVELVNILRKDMYSWHVLQLFSHNLTTLHTCDPGLASLLLVWNPIFFFPSECDDVVFSSFKSRFVILFLLIPASSSEV